MYREDMLHIRIRMWDRMCLERIAEIIFNVIRGQEGHGTIDDAQDRGRKGKVRHDRGLDERVVQFQRCRRVEESARISLDLGGSGCIGRSYVSSNTLPSIRIQLASLPASMT